MAQPMKPMICSQMRPTLSASSDGEHDADDQQDVDQRRALGGEDSVSDQVAETADMVGTGADRRRQDDRREDADAIGAEILDEPRHGGEDGGAPVAVC